MRLRGRVGCHYILPELFWRNFIKQLIAFSFTNLKSNFHYFYQRSCA